MEATDIGEQELLWRGGEDAAVRTWAWPWMRWLKKKPYNVQKAAKADMLLMQKAAKAADNAAAAKGLGSNDGISDADLVLVLRLLWKVPSHQHFEALQT